MNHNYIEDVGDGHEYGLKLSGGMVIRLFKI